MATQHEHDVPISYCQHQSGIRLVELPPELVEIASSKQQLPLTLKSANQQGGQPDAKQPGHVGFCTSNKTFDLKQVQTSNTVLLLRPSVQQPADDSLPLDALQAFATCSSTLELQPIDVGGKTRSAVQWLYDLLPAWSSSMQVSFDQTKKSSAYFDDVPFSHDECDAAWRQLFAFEDNDQGFRPAEKELLDLWRSLKQCTDVTGPFKLEDVYAAMRESDFPPGIIEAVVLSPLTDCLQRDTFSFQEGATVSWLWKLLKSLEAADDSIAHDLEEILPPEWHATGQDVSSKTASPNVTANLANIGVDEKTAKEARQNNTGAAKRIGKQTNWHEKFKRPKK